MAKVKPKGSIYLEILIAILVLSLIGTIMYPKNVWEKTSGNTKLCRQNLDRILKAELIYLKYNNNYEDTLDKVISFIENDSTGKLYIEYLYSDTTLADKILKKLRNSVPEADKKIKTFLADTLLYTIVETTKYDSNLAKVILNRLEKTPLKDSVINAKETDSSDVSILRELSEKFPVLDIVEPIEQDDSLKLIVDRLRPEISVGAIIDTLHNVPNWAFKIDNIVKNNFESIKYCPTNNGHYKIVVIDTSVIKILNVHCPIDSVEIENTKKDFVKYYLGHYRLENHGSIEGGEKSWTKQ